MARLTADEIAASRDAYNAAASSGQTRQQAEAAANAAAGGKLKLSTPTAGIGAGSASSTGAKAVSFGPYADRQEYDAATAYINKLKSVYENYHNDYIKANSSGTRGTPAGQLFSDLFPAKKASTGNPYMDAVYSYKDSGDTLSSLQEHLKQAQEEYNKLQEEYAGSGSWLLTSDDADRMKRMDTLQDQIEALQARIKYVQLDVDAADSYIKQWQDYLSAQNARARAQANGLDGFAWYGQAKAKAEAAQEELDKLEAQRTKAKLGISYNKPHDPMEDYSGWATDDLSTASIYGKADTAALDKAIEQAVVRKNEADRQLRYAGQYRYADVGTSDRQAIALGQSTYTKQNQQWNEQLDKRMSQLSAAGEYGAMGMAQDVLSLSKDYKEPTEKWTEQQRNIYYVLLGDGSDTSRADEFAINTNNLIQQRENQAKAEEYGEAATSSFGAGVLHTAGAIGAGLASGVEYLGDLNEYAARGTITEKEFGLADYNQAVTGSISNYLNNRYGTLGENAGVLAGKGWGDAYQIAQSVGQSWAAMALTGLVFPGAAASAAVNVMFFGQAAKQTLDEQLAQGADPDKAILMGTLAGTAEVLGETLSLENIKSLQAGQTKGLLLDILRSAGIEGSEEGMTTLLNTFADHLVNGTDSEYYVALEGYISQGMSYDQAERAAMKDWVNGIAYDMLAGAASGGISGGIGGPVSRAGNYLSEKIQANDGQKNTAPSQETESASQIENDVDTKNRLLTEDDLAEYMSVGVRQHVRNTKRDILSSGGSPILTSINAVRDFIRSSLSGGNKDTVKAYGKVGSRMASDISNESAGNVDVNGYYLELDANRINHLGDHIDTDADGRNVPLSMEQAENLTEYIDNYDQILDVLTRKDGSTRVYLSKRTADGHIVIVELVSKGRQSLQPVTAWQNTEDAFNQIWGQKNRASTTSHATISAEDSGYKDAPSYDASSAPLEGFSPFNSSISTTAQNVKDQKAYLAKSAATFGPAANDVYNLYSPTQTAREYIAAMDAAINTVVANVSSRSAFEQSESVQYLTKEQRDLAWSEGQKQRTQAQEKTSGKQDQDKGQKKTQPRKGKVSGTLAGMQMKNGKPQLALTTAEGETVTVDLDRALKSGSLPPALAQLAYMAAGLGQHAADIYRLYDPSQTVNDYVSAMDIAINLMASNMSPDKQDAFNSHFLTKDLTEAQKKFAWEEGQKQRESKQAAAKKEEAENENGAATGGTAKYQFHGYAEDGRGKYEGNYPKGTPKKAKSADILSYIQNVWAKKPISLKIWENGKERTILAQFDPTYDNTKNEYNDATKLMGGNRHGTAAEQRVTLDLADDYYKIASESQYNYSKPETGKDTEPHKDVKQWHYFVNGIYFAEYGSKNYEPYMVTINVKEKSDGDFVYSFSAEKEKRLTTPGTLHAPVNNGKIAEANGKPYVKIISRSDIKGNSKQGKVSFGGINLNGTIYAATRRSNVKPEDLRVIETLAKFSGVDVVFYQSKADQRGNYVGANGFYHNGTIYIDTHAGANNTLQQDAILLTAAHELTHFIRDASPSHYETLKEFVTGKLIEQGYDFDALVRQKMDQNKGNKNFDRDAAVEEVVANACEMVLKDSKAAQQLAEERPDLATRIRDWLHEFFSDVRKAFEGVEARHEEARAMTDCMEELVKIWDDALVAAVENRAGMEKGVDSTAARFSIRANLYNDLIRIKNRKFNSKNNEVLIGNTSDFLVNEIGFKPLPFYMPAVKAYRAIVTEAQAIKDGQPTGGDIHYHGLGVNTVYGILEKAETPIAAYVDTEEISNKRDTRILLITDVAVNDGLGVVVVEPNTKARNAGRQIDANKTVTLYDKQSTVASVQKAYDQNRLLYIDKKSGQRFDSGRSGANCPTTISESVRRKNIQDFWGNVKWRDMQRSGKISSSAGDMTGATMADAFRRAQNGKTSFSQRDTSARLTEEEARAQRVNYTRLKAENAALQRRESANAGKSRSAPGKQGKVSFGGINLNGTIYAATRRSNVKPEDLRVIETLAKFSGVDVVFYQSRADQRGNYVGANGFYHNGTIYIDTHAGANNTLQQDAILLTAAHELTHFIRDASPSHYETLKEFVTGKLIEQGYDFDALVRQKMEQNKGNKSFDRDAAVEEVVANACEMVLKDSKAAQQLAEERPDLATRIRDWLHEFFSDVRKAFEGVEARHEEARAMTGCMEELVKIWDEALVAAVENRAGMEKGVDSTADRFSIRANLYNDLIRIKNRKFDSKNNEVLIGNTSDFLVNEIGFKPLPFYMPAVKAYRAIVTEAQAIKDGQPTGGDIHYHGLGVNTVYDILEKAETPIAAYVATGEDGNKRDSRIVIVTNVAVNGGLGVVIVEPNTKARNVGGRVEANKTVTLYDKQSAIANVQAAYDQNRLLYIDKKSGQRFDSGRSGSNCPMAISENVRRKNIQDFWGNVKWRDMQKSGSISSSAGDMTGATMADAFRRAQNGKTSFSRRDTSAGQQAENAALQRRESANAGKSRRTPGKQGKVSFGGINLNGTIYAATRRSNVKPEDLRVIETLAKFSGVDVVFYQSRADQRGNYVGANGFYHNGTIYIDTHAGANNTLQQDAILLTAAHELTHFIRDASPSHYETLKEFVTGKLIEQGYDFDALVRQKMEQNKGNKNFDRDAAVEEVVANACEMVLKDSKAAQQLAEERPDLATRIRDWLHEFFADIRKAFEGVEARHEEARAMTGCMEELVKLWDEALVAAAKNSVEISNDSSIKYSYAGRMAENADESLFQQAEAMEAAGKTSEEIRKETGWFKGMDGKWRYEINDSDIQFSRSGFFTNPDVVRFNELNDKLVFGEITEAEAREARKLSKALKGIRKSPVYLREYIQHDALFKAYPQLQDIRVSFRALEGERGHYSPRKNEIVVSSKLINNDTILKDTLLHEIQHAIQHIEGFATGASREYWQGKIDSGYLEQKKTSEIQAADKRYNELFANAPEELKRKIREINRAKLSKDWDLVTELENEIYDSEYADQYSEIDNADFDRRLIREQKQETTAEDLYMHTAGEIEARDVSRRRSMDAEQRKNTRPDIDREDVVFAEGSTVAKLAKDSKEKNYTTIKRQIEENQDKLNGMEPVADVIVREKDIPRQKTKVLTWVLEKLSSWKNGVDREGFGVIEIGKNHINDGLDYLDTPSEYAAFLAVPRVLKRGIQIDHHKKHGGKQNKDSYTFAAPVTINGVRGNMAVVVNYTTKYRYHVHRILMPDGSAFVFKK